MLFQALFHDYFIICPCIFLPTLYNGDINTKRDPKGVGALGALFFIWTLFNVTF